LNLLLCLHGLALSSRSWYSRCFKRLKYKSFFTRSRRELVQRRCN